MKIYMISKNDRYMCVEKALKQALLFCIGRKLRGHGYDGFRGQMEAVDIFKKGDLSHFLKYHEDLCPEFSSLIKEIKFDLDRRIKESDYCGIWGETYEKEIRENHKYLAAIYCEC